MASQTAVRRSAVALLLCAAAVGCSPPLSNLPDSGADGGTVGPVIDSGHPADGGRDSGWVDAGAPCDGGCAASYYCKSVPEICERQCVECEADQDCASEGICE